MNFFGRKKQEETAIEKMQQWLLDTMENAPESLGDTSLTRLSKQASAELNMPQGTAVKALYDLRDNGTFVKVKGNTHKASFTIKPKAQKAIKAKKAVKPVVKAEVVKPVEEKCAQKEAPAVKVDKKDNSITITIKIDM